MIAKVGFFVFVLGLVLPVFTSSFPLSRKEKDLSDAYRLRKDSSTEAKHAYTHVIVLTVAKCLLAIGFTLITTGYFFD